MQVRICPAIYELGVFLPGTPESFLSGVLGHAQSVQRVDAAYAGNSAEAPAPMTPEAVEKALDEVRPYLIADGGNVEVRHQIQAQLAHRYTARSWKEECCCFETASPSFMQLVAVCVCAGKAGMLKISDMHLVMSQALHALLMILLQVYTACRLDWRAPAGLCACGACAGCGH